MPLAVVAGALDCHPVAVSARRPWWHTTRSPGASLGVAALGTVLAILGWWVFTIEPDGGWWRGWAAGAWTLQAVMYGLSGLIRLRQGEPLRSRDGYGSWQHL